MVYEVDLTFNVFAYNVAYFIVNGAKGMRVPNYVQSYLPGWDVISTTKNLSANRRQYLLGEPLTLDWIKCKETLEMVPAYIAEYEMALL